MSNGYLWDTRLRYTPLNGIVETFDLQDGFVPADGSPRRSVLTRVDLRYLDESDRRMTINYSDRRFHHGIRIEARLFFSCVETNPHYRPISRLVTKLIDPRTAVELSLNAELTYREMILTRPPTIRPFRRKTVAGMLTDVTMRTKELVDILDLIETGTGW